MSWLVMTYRLPADSSRARVAVWRQVRRVGALHLQQSVVALPDVEPISAQLDVIRATIREVGGESLVVRGSGVDADSGDRLREAWNAARDDEYGELGGKCDEFLAEIDKEFAKEKFTLAELEEEEAELDKLVAWHERIAARDVHGATEGPGARALVTQARAALERYSRAVFERTDAQGGSSGSGEGHTVFGQGGGPGLTGS